jgi:hypothetical protein
MTASFGQRLNAPPDGKGGFVGLAVPDWGANISYSVVY